ncbi:MAG TPA: diguanylate cyclase [Anaeromyxobacteraceae bacterium]|nr:diguanylate cyclase [Anaeromyxobacteraceae bacterium]
MRDRQKILVAEPSHVQSEWFQQILTRDGYEVVTASDGQSAIRSLRDALPDLVLLDVVLPDMDGLEVLRIAKTRTEDDFVPVIAVSVKADLDTKVAALRIGADDFLAKPFAEAELLARCAAMLRIRGLQRELLSAKERLEAQATTDWVTGVGTRRLLQERLADEVDDAQRAGGAVSLLIIELDQMERVIERCGPQGCDAVLRQSAELIRGALRPSDVAAVFRAYQFAVLLPGTHVEGALAVAEGIWRAIGGSSFLVDAADESGPVELKMTASIGAAFLPSKDISTREDLVKYSGEALYQAQRSGRNSICLYQAQGRRHERVPQ